MKKRKKARNSQGKCGFFLFGILFSLGFLLVLSLIAAIFLTSVKNPTKNLGAVSLAVFLIGAAMSGFVNSKRGGENGILSSVITSGAFTLLMLVISLILAKGKLSGMVFMNYICYMLVSAFFAFIGRKRTTRHRRR